MDAGGIWVLLIGMLVFLALIGLGIFLLYRLITNFQPSQNKIQNDLRRLKTEIEAWTNQLVPWGREELDTLSQFQSERTVRKGLTTVAKGVFSSIYHEPLVSYAYKRYISAKQANDIMYVRTAKHEFVYRTRKGQTQLFIDNEFIGNISGDGRLFGAHNKQLMARIERSDRLELRPIIVGERELASLMEPKQEREVSDRAFQYVEENMMEREVLVLVAVGVREMILRSI